MFSCITEGIFTLQTLVFLPFPWRACEVSGTLSCNRQDRGLFGSREVQVQRRGALPALGVHTPLLFARTARDEHYQQNSDGMGFAGSPRAGPRARSQPSWLRYRLFTSVEKWKCPSAWHMGIQGQDGVAEEKTLGPEAWAWCPRSTSLVSFLSAGTLGSLLAAVVPEGLPTCQGLHEVMVCGLKSIMLLTEVC